jgi:hypothetical protein
MTCGPVRMYNGADLLSSPAVSTGSQLAHLFWAVLCPVTSVAQGDEVVFIVIARVAAELLVVNFKVDHGSTVLTTPAVPPQYSFS